MCTLEKRGNIYVLTLTGSDEHRLNPTLIDSIRSALRHVQAHPSSALITTAHGKFFSNGYDLSWAQSSKQRLQLMNSKLQSLISELISLPMPTIAALTGHASAAGMIFALSHDYVLMRKDRGFLYMSELDVGLVLPDWFVVVLKCRIGDAKVRHEIVMTAARLTAEMAVARGIVHSALDSAEETVEGAIRLGEELANRGWDGGIYGKNRMVVWSEILEKIRTDQTMEAEISSRSKL